MIKRIETNLPENAWVRIPEAAWQEIPEATLNLHGIDGGYDDNGELKEFEADGVKFRTYWEGERQVLEVVDRLDHAELLQRAKRVAAEIMTRPIFVRANQLGYDADALVIIENALHRAGLNYTERQVIQLLEITRQLVLDGHAVVQEIQQHGQRAEARLRSRLELYRGLEDGSFDPADRDQYREFHEWVARAYAKPVLTQA